MNKDPETPTEALTVECKSEVLTQEGLEVLRAVDVFAWLAGIPKGAVLSPVIRDYGSQRDPDERLVGLRAAWSEVRTA